MTIGFGDMEIIGELGKRILVEQWKLKFGLIEVKRKWEETY